MTVKKPLIQKTLIQNLSHQLSSVFMKLCSRLTRSWELRKHSYKISFLSSHQLPCNSCSRLAKKWVLRELLNSQLWSTLIYKFRSNVLPHSISFPRDSIKFFMQKSYITDVHWDRLTSGKSTSVKNKWRIQWVTEYSNTIQYYTLLNFSLSKKADYLQLLSSI